MTLNIEQRHETFVGEVLDFDVAQASDQDIQDLRTAIDDMSVLIFRGQSLSNDQQAKFAERFGPLEQSVMATRSDAKHRLEGGNDKIVDVSNLDESGKPREGEDRVRMLLLGNRLWHTDSSFREIPGALSMLFAHSVPGEGGETQFCDMRAAYDALPEPLRRQADELSVEHSLMASREKLGFVDFNAEEMAKLPKVRHPLVRTSPKTGRRALYCGAHASHITNMPIPEGRMLLSDLMEVATKREHVYTHEWQVGDLVVWNNLTTMHRGRPYDEKIPRDLRRVTTSLVEVDA